MNQPPGSLRAGVLLHVSSLPSGRLDADSWRYIDWMVEAGFSVWQMLPLGVPLAGVSPYQCASAFALNPALFPEKLPEVLVDSPAFKDWYAGQHAWVEDYALFMAIKHEYEGAAWVNWPTPLRLREANALMQFKLTHEAAINAIIHQQYQLFMYWQTLRTYAFERGIDLFGDMPLFVAHDSADVWAHPECFLLDEAGQPTFVAGVPPDYFSSTGQRWGNPQYNWVYLGNNGFAWWQDRLHYHFECFDLVRLDHFRGLAASWMIPAASETAMDGYWQNVPGAVLLQYIQERMGNLPLVAEDLGVITPDVEALRHQFGLPGMSVLQFSFDDFADNPHKPQNVTEDRVYYTGTHDNDTTLGWFDSLEPSVQDRVLSALEITQRSQVVDKMIAVILGSHARLAIIPMQDLLKLDSAARMNIPGTADHNWQWRFDWAQIPSNLATELHHQIEQTGRHNHA
jgi:4-alpha-glucanotransferase